MKRNYILLNDCTHNFASNDTYVYELINPTTMLPFYVGKGRDNRATRHVSLRKSIRQAKSNPHKNNTINKIINNNQQVIVRLESTYPTEEEAFAREIYLIDKYGRRCDNTGILTNITRGGMGNTSDGIEVYQYHMNGDFIRSWKNAKEACRLNGWNNYSSINACCTGRERSYNGFLWSYAHATPTLLTKVRPIYQWTVDGQLVAWFRSKSEAARAIRCDPSTIGPHVDRGTTTGGWLWTYSNHPPVYTPSNRGRRRVTNLTTNITYDSVSLAAKASNDSVSNVSAVCTGKQLSSKGMVYCFTAQ